MAIRQIKSGKAAGPDIIPDKALKSDIEATVNMLHVPFRKIWEEEQVPMDWKEGHPIKIPKKADLSKCDDKEGNTHTWWMQLDDLDFADDRDLLSNTQKIIQMKTVNVATTEM
ncbi:unnamed protein product [Schistosoma curassoni]|uniref:Reverse transcriptase domain-containing protein n=1 Tax=Schistosoma curassoni TaxID=6186 RepID=A0A183K4U1_9TREM|nr:unnamed protein product [Schistosoma curassoni]